MILWRFCHLTRNDKSFSQSLKDSKTIMKRFRVTEISKKSFKALKENFTLGCPGVSIWFYPPAWQDILSNKMSYRGNFQGGNFRGGWGQGRWVLQKLNIEWSCSVSFIVKLLSKNFVCRYSWPEPTDPVLRMGFLQLMILAGITSTMTWGEAQELMETNPQFLMVHYHQRTFLFNEYQR